MRIALAQINTTVGDITANTDRILSFSRRAAEERADIVVFPELAVTGYPPRDLVENSSFVSRSASAIAQVASETGGLNLTVVCGYIAPSVAPMGKAVENRAAVIRNGKVVFEQTKMLLPNYDVFDEARYFQPSPSQGLVNLHGTPTAITICEDAWNDKQFWERRLYVRDPVEELAQAGAGLIVSVNASPYHIHKRSLRREIFARAAQRYSIPVVYVNQVGGNDQLIFDGSSFAMDSQGKVIASAPSFSEDLVIADFGSGTGGLRENFAEECDAVYEALVLGTRDYLHKCGFSKVVIGLSGGIDSSIVACIAVDAVGRENVTGVAMPGPFSSEGSLRDARSLAAHLGIHFEVSPIGDLYEAFLRRLQPLFHGARADVTEENLQARIRGVTLMAISNKTGAILLTTGNKSELAVGYCTLYGDMCGGLAVISDVPKTLVYQISRVANRRHNNAIPEEVFQKAPSAELRPDQKDSDSLPEYEVLDNVLRGYVENSKTAQEIASEHGYSLPLVRDILNKVDRNEYKRQQAPPGLKVTTRAFGMGRRYPIAQRFSE